MKDKHQYDSRLMVSVTLVESPFMHHVLLTFSYLGAQPCNVEG